MKKSIWTVLLTALVALVAVGCAKETDLSGLKEKVDGLDKRVTALEQAVEKLNKETVPGLENLVNALNKKLTISSIVEGDGEYTIRFSDGTEATIKDGKDGKDGLDAEAPEVSITKGEDGIYYWTVNGELLKDGEGKPIPVTGKGDKGDQGEKGDKGDQGEKGEDGEDGADGADGADGNDGITPLFGTNNEGKLIVSYDGGLLKRFFSSLAGDVVQGINPFLTHGIEFPENFTLGKRLFCQQQSGCQQSGKKSRAEYSICRMKFHLAARSCRLPCEGNCP